MDPVCIGSQLYINRGDTPDQVHRWVDQMAAHGLRMIRLFILWDLTEPRQGRWDWAAYDAAFDAAAEHGMGVVPTLMAQSPPGWMRVTDGSQAIGDVDDPVYWQQALTWTEAVVAHFAPHQALHSWILWNEASRVIRQDHPQAKAAFQAWLSERWDGDIEAYNQRVFKQYTAFQQVLDDPGATTAELAFKAGTQRIDWLWFTVHDLMQRLRDLAAIVRRVDGAHPVHVNPHNLGISVLAAGQSLWEEAKVVDFLGCSAHAPWHSGRFPVGAIHQSIACFADLTRATSPDPERFWISEVQGGPTLYSADIGSRIAPDELRRWLWLGIGGGARATVFWCFNQRREGYEAGEWGLLGVDNQPTTRLAVVAEVAENIAQHQAIFDAARPIEPEVVILYDEDAEALFHVDGIGTDRANPRNANAYHDGLCGAWLWAHQRGHEVGFVHANQVRRSGLSATTQVVLIPSATCLDKQLAQQLTAFCDGGGLVIADGLCGFKTADGVIADTASALQALFGAHLHDPSAGEEGSWTWNDGHLTSPWWLRLDLTPNTKHAEVLARWSDDQAAAVVARRHQQGQAIWLGSLCFQAALADPDTNPLQDCSARIDHPSIAVPAGLVRLAHPGRDANQRRQRLNNGELMTLVHRAAETSSTIIANKGCKIRSLLTGFESSLNAGEEAEITLVQGIAALAISPTTAT